VSLSELYIPRVSWLHRADPRLKLFLTALLGPLLLLYNNFGLMLAAVLLIVAGLASAGIPRERLRRIWAVMLPVLITIPVLWPLFYQSGPTLVHFWRIRVTAWAAAQGLTAAARIAALGFLSTGVLLTTDMRALLRAFVRLGLGFEVALTITIALSYVPRIQRTYEQVTEAQMARGFSLSSGGLLRRARARVPILVAALVSTFRSAEVLARALETRGFGRQDVHRTSLYEVHWRPSDTALAIAAVVLATAALLARLALGFGSHPLYLR